jgi:hypothetical protein
MAKTGRDLLYANQPALACGTAAKLRKYLSFDSLCPGKIRKGHPFALGFSFAVPLIQYKETMRSNLQVQP